MRDPTQRVLQISADPRSLAESEALSEALSEGRPSIASFIYEREDGREVLVIVLGAPRDEPVALTPAPAPVPPPRPFGQLVHSAIMEGGVLILAALAALAIAMVWFLPRQ